MHILAIVIIVAVWLLAFFSAASLVYEIYEYGFGHETSLKICMSLILIAMAIVCSKMVIQFL